MNYLLDTNIVSLAIRQNYRVIQKIEANQENICISCINYFEVRRGFLAVDAPHLTAVFD
jgi:tRNA(fMet)-specific endonuclease VapC